MQGLKAGHLGILLPQGPDTFAAETCSRPRGKGDSRGLSQPSGGMGCSPAMDVPGRLVELNQMAQEEPARSSGQAWRKTRPGSSFRNHDPFVFWVEERIEGIWGWGNLAGRQRGPLARCSLSEAKAGSRVKPYRERKGSGERVYCPDQWGPGIFSAQLLWKSHCLLVCPNAGWGLISPQIPESLCAPDDAPPRRRGPWNMVIPWIHDGDRNDPSPLSSSSYWQLSDTWCQRAGQGWGGGRKLPQNWEPRSRRKWYIKCDRKKWEVRQTKSRK